MGVWAIKTVLIVTKAQFCNAMHEIDFPQNADSEMKQMEDLLRALVNTESQHDYKTGLAERSIDKFFMIGDEVNALKSLEQVIFGKQLA